MNELNEKWSVFHEFSGILGVILNENTPFFVISSSADILLSFDLSTIIYASYIAVVTSDHSSISSYLPYTSF